MQKGLRKWVARLKKGDQSAFVPLYERTSPGLFRFLLWKTGGNRPLAEDILQESYVRFFLHLDRLEAVEDVAIYAYLLRIVKNCLVDKVSRTPQSKREHVSTESIAELSNHAEANSQETAVELRELAIAMESLNQRESEIIWLRDALGFSHQEVASQVGITEAASRQAYVRAKRNLIAGMADNLFPDLGNERGTYATT